MDKIYNKIIRTNGDGTTTIILDVSQTTATDDKVLEGFVYKRADGTDGVGIAYDVRENIFYGTEAPEDTSVLWINGDEPNKLSAVFEIEKNTTLLKGNVLLHLTFDESLVKIFNNDIAQIEVGVKAVYRGDDNNVAQPETAYIYTDSWVTI